MYFLKLERQEYVNRNIHIVLGLELNFRNLATSLLCPLALKARKQAQVHIADESISFKPRTKNKLKKTKC